MAALLPEAGCLSGVGVAASRDCILLRLEVGAAAGSQGSGAQPRPADPERCQGAAEELGTGRTGGSLPGRRGSVAAGPLSTGGQAAAAQLWLVGSQEGSRLPRHFQDGKAARAELLSAERGGGSLPPGPRNQLRRRGVALESSRPAPLQLPAERRGRANSNLFAEAKKLVS